MRSRVLRAFDEHVIIPWEDTEGYLIKGIEKHCDLITSRNIDILLNMKNPASSAIGILAKRPAPIQISFLYYPDTSGFDFMDYIILDSFVHSYSQYYSEDVLIIDECYQPNDSTRYRPKGMAFDLPDDCFVFANFSQKYKYNPKMFDLWCNILRKPSCYKNNILWLLCDNVEDQNYLLREATLRGVGDKLVFAKTTDYRTHLERLHRADLILDTYPCGGHTLTSDAIWAGTPVLSMRGKDFCSRVSYSISANSGNNKFIADDEYNYLTKAEAYMKDSVRQLVVKQNLIDDRDNKDITLFSGSSYATRFTKMLEHYGVIS